MGSRKLYLPPVQYALRPCSRAVLDLTDGTFWKSRRKKWCPVPSTPAKKRTVGRSSDGGEIGPDPTEDCGTAGSIKLSTVQKILLAAMKTWS